jgi:hypothetical protein
MSSSPFGGQELATIASATPARTSHRLSSGPEDGRVAQHQLAPVDGGIAAWRLLGAAFVFETLFWGKHGRSLVSFPMEARLLLQEH